MESGIAKIQEWTSKDKKFVSLVNALGGGSIAHETLKELINKKERE